MSHGENIDWAKVSSLAQDDGGKALEMKGFLKKRKSILRTLCL
jgi:hypothetical protein